MLAIYKLFLPIIKFLLLAGTPFSKKLKIFFESRKAAEIYLNNFENKAANLAWFHCASLGEFEQAKPLIDFYLKAQWKVFVTFFSPSGYTKVVKNISQGFYVNYLPLEDSAKIKAMITKINPTIIFWVKYEFWLISLSEIFKTKIPIYLISASFRKEQFLFKLIGKPWLKLVSQFSHVFVQDYFSQQLLAKHNIVSSLAGDTRFDNVLLRRKQALIIDQIIDWKKKDKNLLILGSSWTKEEEILQTILPLLTQWQVIIAPHDITQRNLARIKKLFHTDSFCFWSDFSKNLDSKIIVIDNVGLLFNLYQYADVAIIGGGFSNALHNILEPFSFNVPVFTGPMISKNWEALNAQKIGILRTFEGKSALYKLLDEVQEGAMKLNIEATKIEQFMSTYSGAKKNILDYIYKNYKKV